MGHPKSRSVCMEKHIRFQAKHNCKSDMAPVAPFLCHLNILFIEQDWVTSG
jgi:hypothetical protein